MDKLLYDRLDADYQNKYRLIEGKLWKIRQNDQQAKKELGQLMDQYQNDDGGFPGFLEPDIRSSKSTIISTVMALRIYYRLQGIDPKVKEKLTTYLDNTYDEQYLGWHILSADINDAPHAEWWDHEDLFGYPNPTAEILGYIAYFLLPVAKIDFVEIINRLEATINDQLSMHDFLSLTKMYQILNYPQPQKLLEQAERLIEWDQYKWDEYCLLPTAVITSENHPLYTKYARKVKRCLIWQKEKLFANGYYPINWTWKNNLAVFEQVKQEAQGIKTLELVEVLNNFNLLNYDEIYLAGGCFWGLQAYFKTIAGVHKTEVGQANGHNLSLSSIYDDYAECVKITFDPTIIDVKQLLTKLWVVINPYSINQQGNDIGRQYRTGIYSDNEQHLIMAKEYIDDLADPQKIMVEVLPLENYVKSEEFHQDYLDKNPHGYCHIPAHLLGKK